MAAYVKQTWVDLETPVDAAHLNYMEEGIDANSKATEQNATDIGKLSEEIDDFESALEIHQLLVANLLTDTFRVTQDGIRLTVDGVLDKTIMINSRKLPAGSYTFNGSLISGVAYAPIGIRYKQQGETSSSYVGALQNTNVTLTFAETTEIYILANAGEYDNFVVEYYIVKKDEKYSAVDYSARETLSKITRATNFMEIENIETDAFSISFNENILTIDGTISSAYSSNRINLPAGKYSIVSDAMGGIFGNEAGIRCVTDNTGNTYLGRLGTVNTVLELTEPGEIYIYVTKGEYHTCTNSVIIAPYGEEITAIDHVARRKAMDASENRLNGVNVAVVGDSISAGANNDGIGYAEMIGSRTGAIIDNHAVSGSTWVLTAKTDGSYRGHILAQVQEIIDSGNTPDIVVLSGGYNDSQASILNTIGTVQQYDSEHTNVFNGGYDTETVAGSIEEAIWRLHTYLPLCQIMYVITYPMGVHFSTTYVPVIKQALEKWCVPYVDFCKVGNMFKTGMPNASLIFTDNVHPNDIGYDRMSRYVEAKLKEMV